ncbi:hydantoinase B/oxoprolinase family protein [Gluconacetobacter azotocaptans]|uniref:Hydantoinase B/oxoprolinase family protein n=1 Tax=Gluconacetobacter azotocaptans TaxID=142834 RepID=A0A7W4JSU9_9PROT|nr:hydantoinase B/oxoprolinase family protein [Gluconacetobacter azotocaptans]MBB2190271.1 hydantoinase B/oxoprolinase family protein [Gluconacetobacter azotocaptans]MBM9400696.1 hydantoinase B/oxoprolinase family protein [Gluconacetobacter azotocaptans]GBQ27346.1 N-methylhydantoinase B [Gluconacetobacter azotocaptans DSM 13594]
MHGTAHGEIDLQIMWNRLIAVVGEQAQVLIRTAFSPIVRECEDISAGIFDIRGRMIAQAVTGTPGHVNSMAESVGHFLRHFPIETMKEGDAYITNDPWMGTGHLNDFVITTPAFHRGKLVGLFSCTSHLMDIGGLGNGPEATDVYMEGLSIPMLKLIDQGKVNETLMEMIRANTRLPVDTEGDTYSLAACNDIGVRALRTMMEEFALDTLEPLADFIIDRSRQAVLDKIAALPKGVWSHEMTIDGYDAPLTLKARLTIGEDGVLVDYDGTAPAVSRGINVPLAYTKAYTVFGLACAISPDVPNNAGSLAPYRVVAPAGSVLNALRPAPVSSRHIIGQMLPDMVFGCLRTPLPDRIPAEGTSCLWNIAVRGQWNPGGASTPQTYALAITTNGGTGARPGLDGLSATAFPSGVHGTPVEIAELQCPLIFWQKELRDGSGGDGATKGGDGQVMRIGTTQDRPFELLAAFDRVCYPPRGAQGGGNGAPGRVLTASGRTLPGKGLTVITPDDTLILMTPGGAGLGPC